MREYTPIPNGDKSMVTFSVREMAVKNYKITTTGDHTPEQVIEWLNSGEAYLHPDKGGRVWLKLHDRYNGCETVGFYEEEGTAKKWEERG